MIEFLSQPWHWAVSGAALAVIMGAMLYLGERFGVSASFDAMCSMGGGGRWADHFKFDWRQHTWLLVFILGAIVGGYVGSHLLPSPDPVAISQATITSLQEIGIETPVDKSEGLGFVPTQIISLNTLFTPAGFLCMVIGGFLIGFGTRYASGCTSGHAISGLANLQLRSLVAVIGFFIGGLIATNFLLPIILLM